MKSFQKRNKFRRILESKVFLVLLGILIVIFTFSVFGFLGKMQETAKNKKIVEDKIAELEKSQKAYSTDISSLKTDQGVEENIRKKFGLVKEGENMIMITDDNTSTPTQNTSSPGFFSFIKNWFK